MAVRGPTRASADRLQLFCLFRVSYHVRRLTPVKGLAVTPLTPKEESPPARKRGGDMRSLKYVALLGVLLFALASSAHAQVSVGVRVGPVVAGVGPAPVCAYGYYGYYPYACAPYGYYGPSWFAGGVFIGAGPWFHSYYGRPVYGHPGYGYRPASAYEPRDAYRRTPVANGYVGGGHHVAAFRGGDSHGGGGRR
jgi:hypothetical protein